MMAVALFLVFFNDSENGDFMVATADSSGLSMKTVSKQRGMVNVFEVEGEVPVWIPGGLGWYRSDKLLSILEQEKKTDLLADVFFYNFGFVPNVVTKGDTVWWRDRSVISKLGLINYLKYVFNHFGLMTKQELVTKTLIEDDEKLGKLIQRDLSNSLVLREDLRLNVYNVSQGNGLGAFMSGRLEGAGLTVIGIDSAEKVIDDPCLFVSSKSGDNWYGVKLAKTVLPFCGQAVDELLGANEVEIYFGDGFSKMINYESYLEKNKNKCQVIRSGQILRTGRGLRIKRGVWHLLKPQKIS
jgi:hypothetical protein